MSPHSFFCSHHPTRHCNIDRILGWKTVQNRIILYLMILIALQRTMFRLCIFKMYTRWRCVVTSKRKAMTYTVPRINGFIGMLTRTYWLHDIVLSPTLVSSSRQFNARDTALNRSKAVLKLVIAENRYHIDEQEQRFGFTFFWRGHSKIKPNRANDTAKFALAPDSLVKTALTHWIGQQKLLATLNLISVMSVELFEFLFSSHPLRAQHISYAGV